MARKDGSRTGSARDVGDSSVLALLIAANTVLADPSDITPISIVDEMKSSYLDYAMSVIVARALPDVRDGLKPVHRRILFSAQESGFF